MTLIIVSTNTDAPFECFIFASFKNRACFRARLDAQVEPVQAELIRTLHSFHDAAESVHKLLGPQSGLGEEAVRTLQQVTETAGSLQRLADFLERNPNALITGKRPPDKDH